MATQWTKQQREVIDTRGRNLLVSAAAGSGKTAVLVERILSLVTDQEHPVDIDRLLVVTFTKAAAGEMRQRIEQGLMARLENDPEDPRLSRQLTLLHHGQICTIDSFCTYVLRNYFYAIDLDPGFRVADEGELRLLKEDVIRKLLEDHFEKAGAPFLNFIEYFATGKNDENIEELILKLYDFANSHPRPQKWLAECDAVYRMTSSEELQASEMWRIFVQHVRYRLEGLLACCREAKDLVDSEDGPHFYSEALAAERKTVEEMLAADHWEQWREILRDRSSLRLPAPRKEQVDPKLKALAADRIRTVRESLKELSEEYFAFSPEEILGQLQMAAPAVHTLVELTLDFGKRFYEKKQEKNILDFSDLEHLTLQILTDDEGNPTEIAGSFREYFEEIMIDEYQDSNRLQESILTAISREDGYFMVGDVKQSIYRFRQACPALFTEKMRGYHDGPSKGQVISLHKNFRSRKQVLDSVNDVFFSLMQPETGKIAYDEEAMLYPGADYGESEDARYQTEVLSMCEETLPEDSQKEDLIREEAKMVAARILELTDPQTGLTIKGEQGDRKAMFKDVAILLRSRGQWTDTFVDTLMEEGIPAYSESVAGFYATKEIQTVQNYLSLIDNECQDIPLCASLASPIGNFSSAELAVIRTAFPEKCFYQAARDYAVYGMDNHIRQKLQTFYEMLSGFRETVPYTQIHELLWRIYDETGYYDYASAMPGGTLRKANLDMLVDQAIAFEATSYKGLFHFLRYIEQIRKYEIDIGEASVVKDSVNAVQIMTIHKSKGLEFPVVFVSGLGKQFNDQDERQMAVFHSDYGIGVDAVDLEKRVKTSSVIKEILKEQNHLENRAEEIRVLYVAMTRAREKLILTVLHKEKDAIEDRARRKLSYQEILKATGMWKWLRLIVGGSDAFLCREILPKLPAAAEEDDGSVASKQVENTETGQVDLPDIDREAAELEQRISYVYPYTGKAYSAKLSVSELKKLSAMEAEGEPESDRLYQEPVPVPLIPKFAAETKETKAVERGTAYHKLLECMDYSMEGTTEHVAGLLERLVEEGRIQKEAADTIEIARVVGFLQSDIGIRMRRAAGRGQLWREKPFVIGIEASEVYPDAGEEMLMIQGIIDAYFREGETLVVVDYKTDQVSKKGGREKLCALYGVQLEYYGRALTRLAGMEVKEACIYSFALEEEIPVDIGKGFTCEVRGEEIEKKG